MQAIAEKLCKNPQGLAPHPTGRHPRADYCWSCAEAVEREIHRRVDRERYRRLRGRPIDPDMEARA